MVRGCKYVIAIRDMERSSRFYRDVLGFEVPEIGDPGWRFFVKDACVIMAIMASEGLVHNFGHQWSDDRKSFIQHQRRKNCNHCKNG